MAKKEKRRDDAHLKILKKSLRVLIKILPQAIREFKGSPSGRTAYPITNIIGEIRNLIAQIESSVNQETITEAVSQAVAWSLRGAMSKMITSIVSTKKSLPLKVDDTDSRREIGLYLDNVLKEFEAIMAETIPDVENRVHLAVQKELKTPARGLKKRTKRTPKKKRGRNV
jgi:hypothetical protein